MPDLPPSLSVVIPCYNEEPTVEAVVRSHAAVARTLVDRYEILVSDDGSTDRSAAIVEVLLGEIPELRLHRGLTNRGIPSTMKDLYADSQGEWVYFTPADGQVPAEALTIMWSINSGAALVVGRRIPRRDPATRILMAELYSLWLRAVFRLPVHDIDSVKLYRRSELEQVPPRSASNFFEAEILIALCRRHATVREIEIPHRPRISGRPLGVTLSSALPAIADLLRFSAKKMVRSVVPGDQWSE